MVKEGMWKHGGKITENIRHIKKPERKNVKENKTTIIYKDDGTPVKREDITDNSNGFWSTVYRQRENRINDVLNENTRTCEQIQERDGRGDIRPDN